MQTVERSMVWMKYVKGLSVHDTAEGNADNSSTFMIVPISVIMKKVLINWSRCNYMHYLPGKICCSVCSIFNRTVNSNIKYDILKVVIWYRTGFYLSYIIKCYTGFSNIRFMVSQCRRYL